MSSYRQILYHLIFRTKESKKSLPLKNSLELYAYIYGIIRNKNCYLYRINGTEDHIHILCSVHPTIALADLMRDIKTSTSIWLKQHKGFPEFEGWAGGYAAFTYSYRDKEKIINYIKNQQQHHIKVPFNIELRKLIKEQGIEINEQYFP